MSSEQQSCLRFSVEESIWFQKGQEVAELISIALDPDIQIYEQDQYVSIRGALQLTGEYQVQQEVGEEDYEPQARIIQEVEEKEDGICSMQHRFPVDITIPLNRIQSLDDIYVAIDSFDYSVPQRGCLQLAAELSISGIYGHQQSAPAWEEEAEEEQYEVEPNRDHEEVYQSQQQAEYEDHQEEEVQDEQEEAYEYEPMYRSANTDNEYEEDSYQYYTEDDEEEEILNQHEINASNQYHYNEEGEYAPFEVEARKQAVEEEAPYNPADYMYQDQNEEGYSSLYSLQNQNNYNRVNQYAVEEVEEEVHESQHNVRDENSLSLTEIFADEDSQEFTKLKICIVQQGESMDHIAERYDVSVQQLIRVNRLSTDDHIDEGQLLYIPVKASSKS